jgi:uncharacterized membrane protein YfcA
MKKITFKEGIIFLFLVAIIILIGNWTNFFGNIYKEIQIPTITLILTVLVSMNIIYIRKIIKWIEKKEKENKK